MENVANILISVAVPMRDVDEFSVSNLDSDIQPAQSKIRRILALQSSEEE